MLKNARNAKECYGMLRNTRNATQCRSSWTNRLPEIDKIVTALRRTSDYMRARAFNHLIKQKGRTAFKPLNSFPQSFFVKQVVNNKKNGIANKNSKTDKKTTHFLPEVSNLAAITTR